MKDNEIDLDSLSTAEHGYTVVDEDDDDAVLLDRNGDPVETWRERYPYDERMSRHDYEHVKRRLQIELLKLQRWSKRTGARHVIVFEGRDAAGKGGTIQRLTQHLNLRGARVVALEKPTETEKAQWYFQRYVTHLPTAGEMVLFDRSWYNRAGVEKVMGFCTPEEHAEFMESKWDAYTAAKEEMFAATDTDFAPWIVVKSNDKKRARINAMRHLLWKFDYDDKDHDVATEPDPQIVGRALED